MTSDWSLVDSLVHGRVRLVCSKGPRLACSSCRQNLSGTVRRIVQLVRAFAAHGYPVDPVLWMRAYFAVGGSFRHAADMLKLVTEMQRGVRHRVKPRYRDEIYDILLARIHEEDGAV